MDAKKKKIIIVLVIVALIAAIIYWYIKGGKKTDDKEEETPNTSTTVFPLKMGSRGKEVEQLQIYIFKEYGAKTSITGAIDGIWGVLTNDAVKKHLLKDNVSKDSYDKWKLAEIKTTVFA